MGAQGALGRGQAQTKPGMRIGREQGAAGCGERWETRSDRTLLGTVRSLNLILSAGVCWRVFSR